MKSQAVGLVVLGLFACGDDSGPSGPRVDAGTGCTGTPTPCSSRPFDDCGYPCEPVEDCSGIAASCDTIFDLAACSNQEGCTWDSSARTCGGVATGCILLEYGFQCERQQGCTLTESCEGTPRPCEELPATVCFADNYPGCSYMP